jgi:hypothetical protein
VTTRADPDFLADGRRYGLHGAHFEARFVYTPSIIRRRHRLFPHRWLVEFTIATLSEVPVSVTRQLKGSITLGDGDTHSCTHTLSTSAGNALYVTGTGTIDENEIGSVSLGSYGRSAPRRPPGLLT